MNILVCRSGSQVIFFVVLTFEFEFEFYFDFFANQRKMPPIPKAPPSIHDPKLLSRTHAATPDDEIVISGISGKFPNSRNVEEFAENLYNKVSFNNITINL